jgi:hypothetical protein
MESGITAIDVQVNHQSQLSWSSDLALVIMNPIP